MMILDEKVDYHIFAIEQKALQQVSYISAKSVKLNDWNIVDNLIMYIKYALSRLFAL